ncbi:hypothetical protein IMCC26134_10735 [Verrucomicrobia bacterium IMCC26134]|jgi:hypothetical protein|nr:hypothetical protein IMCC26134_10735 [Verrucomicrobia bacterium IMCC26134]
MKKTAAKTKAITKAAPAIKAAPVKKTAAPAVKLVKAKTPVPVKKVAPAPKKSRAVKASVATPAPAVPSGTTTIVASIDVGFGNKLTLRGAGPGLSWERGVDMDNTTSDLWAIILPETNHPVVFKFLLNDVTWSAGDDYTVLPGSSVVLSPSF